MSIEIDLHSHLKPSKLMKFDLGSFERMIRQAKSTGLAGFATTEHFHAPDYWPAHRELLSRFPYRDGRYHVDSHFTILSGAEIDVAEGGHVLAIGPLDALDWLDRQFDPTLNEGYRPPAAILIETARHVDLVLIGAHPTRQSKFLAGVGLGTLAGLDALEINGKDVADDGDTAWVRNAADTLGLATVGSSDAHVWAQIGAQRTFIDIDRLTVQHLRDGLVGRVDSHIWTSAAIKTTVRVAKRHKTIAKQAAKLTDRHITPEVAATLEQRYLLPSVSAVA